MFPRILKSRNIAGRIVRLSSTSAPVAPVPPAAGASAAAPTAAAAAPPRVSWATRENDFSIVCNEWRGV